MGSSDLSPLFLACLLVVAFASALDENSPILPSETAALNCTDAAFGADTIFKRKSSTTLTSPFVKGMEVTARCDKTELKEVRVKYGDKFDTGSVGNDTWTCNTYENGKKSFTVMELTVNKPDNSKTDVTCTHDNKNCSLAGGSEKETRFVVGMPSGCTVYVDPSPAGKENGTGNATESGQLTVEIANRTFSPSETVLVTCTYRCSEAEGNGTCRKCPEMTPVPLGKADARKETLTNTTTGESCTSTMELSLDFFDQERMEVLVVCYVGHQKEFSYATFEKKLYSEACKHDVDCWGGMWCQNGTCACPKVAPAFIRSRNKCLPGSSYGEKCDFKEQCRQLDQHSECVNGTCKCEGNMKPAANETQICVN